MAIEDVVAQHQGTVISSNEVGADMEGLGQTIRAGLLCIGKRNAKGGAIAQNTLELQRIFWRGNDQNVANPGQHQRAERIVDHRLVEDRHKLLRHALGQWVEPSP